MRSVRVGVVGTGTAGPAAALQLARRLGWQVTLFDKAAEPSAVGAGIGVQPIGMTALHRLGLLGQIMSHGARVDGIQTVTSEGRRVLDIAYERFDRRLFGLGLHRGVLFQALREACDGQPLVEQRFGVQITEIDQASDRVTLRDANATAHGPFDLVVVADGANSQLRPQLGIPSWYRRYCYGALFALLPDPGHTFGNQLQQVHSGPGCHVTLGFLPTGRPWGGGPGEDTATLFFNMRHDELDHWRSRGLRAFVDQCIKLKPDAEALLESTLHHPDQLAFASYSDGVCWQYHQGRVVCIGDASHAMSPQLGQGANLALIDALKLVECLEQQCDGFGGAAGNVPAALADYTRERWTRVNFYSMQSRFLTPFFASRSRMLRVLRDALFWPACHTPLLRTYMHAVLCGALSPKLLSYIPEEEFLGFLDALNDDGSFDYARATNDSTATRPEDSPLPQQ